jgi:hypothetical protein
MYNLIKSRERGREDEIQKPISGGYNLSLSLLYDHI